MKIVRSLAPLGAAALMAVPALALNNSLADGGLNGSASAVQTADRCDLGFNTKAFNKASVPGVPHAHDDTQPVDFTLEEWAEVFVPDESARQVTVDFINRSDSFKAGILSGGLTHTLTPDPWNPMTDAAQCAQLGSELARAKVVAAKYPTVAAAKKAGYVKVTDYLPGIAAHFMKFPLVDGKFVLEEPEMLLYDGEADNANMVGLSYYIIKDGDTEPEAGFAGNNDHYHRHLGLCISGGVVVAGSTSTPEECAKAGGRKAEGGGGWMNHVWIVPGCESDWGVFSGANPALPVRGMPGSTPQQKPGCGTGKSLSDAPAFDSAGGGPRL